MLWPGRGVDAPVPFSLPYSPKCLEGVFSEVHLPGTGCLTVAPLTTNTE
jgi:hypothetical protein